MVSEILKFILINVKLLNTKFALRHNYHHVFPFDYKTGEFGGWKGYKYNITTALIDFFAQIGWAYDRKSATNEMIKRRVLKSGDGSHENIEYILNHDAAHQTGIWGYGDKDINIDDQKELENMID